MRAEKSELTPDPSRLLTGTQGLLGTAFPTFDFADQWDPDARGFVARHRNASGPRVPVMLRLSLRPDGLPAAAAAAYDGGQYTVGTYNWENQAADIPIPLRALGIPDSVQSRPTGGGPCIDMEHTEQSPTSLRIIELQESGVRETEPFMEPEHLSRHSESDPKHRMLPASLPSG